MIVAGPIALSGVVDADPQVRFAFSDLGDGNMSLAVGDADGTARSRLAAAVGAGPADLVFMQQVHGPDVAVVGATDRGRGTGVHGDGIPGVDALVTFDAGVALAVLVADCVPVVLADPDRAIAVIHAGRGGVMTGVVSATLAAMAPPAAGNVRAVIGPAIGGCCYEVPATLAEQVATGVPDARATTTWGTTALDLPAAVAAQLRTAGVTDVRRMGGCTRCDGSRWFS
ncbi:MAG TPA: polyphenol oxidase family protein, partial [Euzebyales bacterium]|nr:polyphenol oxidase family protein [Euzebyales bacterium]